MSEESKNSLSILVEEYPVLKTLLSRIYRSQGIEVDLLKLILMLDYKKRLDEAEKIIHMLITLGLVEPVWSGKIVEYYVRRSRKKECRNVYCLIDEDPEILEKCCEKVVVKLVKLIPTKKLEEAIGFIPI